MLVLFGLVGKISRHDTDCEGIMGASTQAVAGAGVEAEEIVFCGLPRIVLFVLAFCLSYIAGALGPIDIQDSNLC